ncbi:ATP-binding protein [Methylocystis rosea]|uniref:ATP-binding protein n=1 Tax=Methylocystis rosea TaxID=173366 RepID=UPI0026C7D5A9
MVTLAVRRIGNDVELTVADDGIGMPAQGQGNTPGQHGSNYVTIFVRQLSGTLVRSGAPGVGTTFRIVFPMSPDPETSPRQ